MWISLIVNVTCMNENDGNDKVKAVRGSGKRNRKRVCVSV